jgi:hypothetical protein
VDLTAPYAPACAAVSRPQTCATIAPNRSLGNAICLRVAYCVLVFADDCSICQRPASPPLAAARGKPRARSSAPDPNAGGPDAGNFTGQARSRRARSVANLGSATRFIADATSDARTRERDASAPKIRPSPSGAILARRTRSGTTSNRGQPARACRRGRRLPSALSSLCSLNSPNSQTLRTLAR